ncbi:MAG TPA: glutamate--cysteine ligase, partial [Alphaproteobacteria bacterium]|nr:glutamate--cysteine ligase [Alphaproteobacteria bacterium]
MSQRIAEAEVESPPVEGRHDLVEYLASGCRPKEEWRIGTEHEKFGYRLSDLGRLDYEGPQGIRAVLEGLQRFGWKPIYEAGNLIALHMDGQSVTLEPGGQLELSGAPLRTVHQTCNEVSTHLAQVREVAKELGIGFLGLGFAPRVTLDETPVMPKGRYKIMSAYMDKKGKLGRDMMFRTCTVQVNLDFSSEADMVKKFRTSMALQPVATALFANSPFTEGKPNGYLSYRAHIWTDTDPDRTGVLPFLLDPGMGFERYVDYALDVPMYFVYRNGTYIDASGQSFRDFMEGKLPALPGERPTIDDWSDHLTTIFPEVRLKKFLEMRGADGGQWSRLCALPALWVGLLYDDVALDAAWDLVKTWSYVDIGRLRDDVSRQALNAKIGDRTMRDFAREILKIASE